MDTPEVIIVDIEEIPNHPANNQFSELNVLLNTFFTEKSLAKNSRRSYLYQINNFIKFINKSFDKITYEDIVSYKVYLQQKNLKPNGIRLIISSIKCFYKWLKLIKRINDNPAEGIITPNKQDSNVIALTDSEVTTILNAITNKRDLALVSLMLNGLRPSEPLILKHSNYDGDSINIEEAKWNTIGIVPLFDWVKKNLNDYIDSKENYTDDSYLFNQLRHDNKITYSTVEKLILKLNKETGIKFQANQFRHTFATNLMLKGMEPSHILTLIRDRDPNSLRVYTKSATTITARAAFDKLNLK